MFYPQYAPSNDNQLRIGLRFDSEDIAAVILNINLNKQKFGKAEIVARGECNLNSVWFLFLLNHNKYNFFFLDLQMLLKVVFGCVQGRRRMSRLYTLAHIRELPFLCV